MGSESRGKSSPEDPLSHWFGTHMGSLRAMLSRDEYMKMHGRSSEMTMTIEFSRQQAEKFIAAMVGITTGMQEGTINETENINQRSISELITYIRSFDYQSTALTLEDVRAITQKFYNSFPNLPSIEG